MEIPEDQTIAKRKRSKRPRPLQSSPSSSGTGESNRDSPVYSSPASSGGVYTSADREDEEMANCLILLAQGDSQSTDAIGETKLPGNKSGGGRVGIYVYECKTCGRTFPSFQALGGHRASHKRPKLGLDSDRNKSPPAGDPGEERKSISSDATVGLPISTQLVNKGLNIGKKMRTHECSICGSEFGSGQALGGHMRKHRAASNNSNTSKSGNDCESSLDEIGGTARTVPAVDFDLNLPAPPAEEVDQSGLDFEGRFPSLQRSGLVFSSAALVGCHY